MGRGSRRTSSSRSTRATARAEKEPKRPMADPSDLTKASVAAMPFATYPEGHGNKVKLYGLASDDNTGAAGAFADLAAAIEKAESFIFVVDWSFQPYVRLKPRIGAVGVDQTAG